MKLRSGVQRLNDSDWILRSLVVSIKVFSFFDKTLLVFLGWILYLCGVKNDLVVN